MGHAPTDEKREIIADRSFERHLAVRKVVSQLGGALLENQVLTGFFCYSVGMKPTRRNGRPPNENPSETIEVTGVEPKLMAYLNDLRKMDGFGNSISAIARGFVWKEINRLIEAGRLKQR